MFIIIGCCISRVYYRAKSNSISQLKSVLFIEIVLSFTDQIKGQNEFPAAIKKLSNDWNLSQKQTFSLKVIINNFFKETAISSGYQRMDINLLTF